MIRTLLVGLAMLTLGASPASAWGPTGHRIAARIAEDNIAGNTRAHVEQILGRETLVEASTVPDEQRSNPAPFWQRTASPYHYVTLPEGVDTADMVHPPEGDAETALAQFTATLRDPAASREDKALALRFIVHIVADLHMPLHVGNGTDRGGNDLAVLWKRDPQPTNLHWVWDEGLILNQQLSFSEYAARLEARTLPGELVTWWDARPQTWIAESAALRDRIYPETGAAEGEFSGAGTREDPVRLGYSYIWQWTPTMEQRLQQAGVRLAAYLDRVFAETD